jgi:hypothetical protein
MILYHYLKEQFGLNSLRDNRLKISRLLELNDPFEFLGLSIEDDPHGVVEQTKNELSKTVGIICLSKNWDEILMWSHYANSHTGICLGFEIEEANLMEVNYQERRLTLADLGIDSIAEFGEPEMRKLLLTKFKTWTYESEYRVFASTDECDAHKEIAFFKLADTLHLREVILGVSSSIQINQLTELLGDRASSVKYFKAKLHGSEFKLNREELTLQNPP